MFRINYLINYSFIHLFIYLFISYELLIDIKIEREKKLNYYITYMKILEEYDNIL